MLRQSLFFNKGADLSLQLYLKRDSGAGVFLRVLRNFQEHLFKEHLWGTPSADTYLGPVKHL